MSNPYQLDFRIGLEEVGSTQDYLIDLVKSDPSRIAGVVWARSQTAGRGRHQRPWISEPDGSLAMSLALGYASHWERPWLIGMALAVIVAEIVDAEVRWPNDVHFGERKVGGILTEVVTSAEGRAVPIVGIGVNLRPHAWPGDLGASATSVLEQTDIDWSADELREKILDRMGALPDLHVWSDISARWMERDRTSGKCYRLPTGEVGIAKGIGPEGELLCRIGAQVRSVLAADALVPHAVR